MSLDEAVAFMQAIRRQVANLDGLGPIDAEENPVVLVVDPTRPRDVYARRLRDVMLNMPILH